MTKRVLSNAEIASRNARMEALKSSIRDEYLATHPWAGQQLDDHVKLYTGHMRWKKIAEDTERATRRSELSGFFADMRREFPNGSDNPVYARAMQQAREEWVAAGLGECKF